MTIEKADYLPKFNLKGIGDKIRLNAFKGTEDSFPYDGLWMFSGSQGSGKTLLMMHAVRDIVTAYPDVLIVSNISIFGVPSIPYQGIEDFEKYNNGKKGIVYVIDEIHTLFNSLESKNMPVSTIQVWSQNRKNRRVILGTSQRFTRIAKGIREQCKWHYECSGDFLGLIYKYRVLDGGNYNDEGKYILKEDEEMPRRHFYIPNKNAMLMYNTLEVVRRDDGKDDEK